MSEYSPPKADQSQPRGATQRALTWVIAITATLAFLPGVQPALASSDVPRPDPVSTSDRAHLTLDRSDLPTEKARPGDFVGAVKPGLHITALVDVDATKAQITAESLDRADLDILRTGGDRGLIQAEAGQLRELLKSGLVTRVERSHEPIEMTTSEGLASMGVPPWHNKGYGGQGIKIAIVEMSFLGYRDLLGVELPGTVFTRSFRFDGAIEGYSKHGTAVAEVVHDVAPGAQLHFVTIDSEFMLDEVVDYLIANDIDIVNMSMAWINGPFDGSTIVSREVKRASDAGIFWVNAAGNEAMTHWGGSYVDRDADDIAEFLGEDEVNAFIVPPQTAFEVALSWDSAYTDLDLCLVEIIGADLYVQACSVGSQFPGDRPLETIYWSNDFYTIPQLFGFVVMRYRGTPNDFHVFVSPNATPGLEHQVKSRSIPDPAFLSSVVTVGAVDWTTPTTIESYSSRGPTLDGRTKPDYVAPAVVSTRSYGNGDFAGTSASSPHVAGLAALILETKPWLSRSELRSELTAMAIRNPGPTGKNNTFGWGLVQVGTVPQPHGNYACDFEADGYSDLAIGVPGEDLGSTVDAGGVSVTRGMPRTLYLRTPQTSSGPRTVRASKESQRPRTCSAQQSPAATSTATATRTSRLASLGSA